jgi:hypothetical protein
VIHELLSSIRFRLPRRPFAAKAVRPARPAPT